MFAAIALSLSALLGACGACAATPDDPPALITGTVTYEDGSTGPAVWATEDPGSAGQYPATVWHYASAEEDDAGRDCDARGGSMVDAPAERFVCVVD